MRKTKSIKSKLMLSIFSIIFLLSLCILFAYAMAFNSFFDKKSSQVLLDASNTMRRQFDDQLRLAGQSALRMAFDREFRSAVLAGNAEAIHRTASRLITESRADLCVVTDGSGTVLARTHSDRVGDNMAWHDTIYAALNGASTAYLGTGSGSRLSLNGGAPVYSDSETVAGTVLVGFRIDTNRFVDEVKQLTSQEIMVFLRAECIASTLEDEFGERLTAIKVDPEISAKVLSGTRHMGRMTLAGDDYLVCYSPLTNGDTIVGMLFTGLSIKAQGQTLKDFLVIGGTVTLVALMVMLVLVYRAVDKVVGPMRKLTEAFEHVTSHMGDACMMTSGIEDLLPESDVTEITYLQGALRAMLERLDRTYEIQVRSMEAELEKGRILAASQAKDRVFANISHEIRTPMNAILGISDILLHEGNLTVQQKQYIRDVKISTENLLVIVNDVLDLSKLEAGKMDLSPVDYNFHLFLSNIESLAGHLAEGKGLRFHLTAEGDIPRCLYGDDVRLREILVNLLGNAAKFTSQGHFALDVRVGKNSLCFVVRDTGIGIPKDRIPHLFEAFQQMDSGVNRQIGGTGLGLPICKHLVELMNGSIHVASELGKGSTFTVTVPKIPGDESKLHVWEDEMGVAIDRDARVLIVDDQRINLNVARGLIRAFYGIECDTAASGSECVRKAMDGKYDLIFMDHMMPGMDGVETLHELRRRGGYLERVPVIALTANAVNGVREHLLASGMNGFLSKPIRKKELRETMLRWLGREGAAPPATETQTHIPREWEGVPDLNISEGIDNAGGQADVFIQSLCLLRKSIPGFVQTARGLFEADDLDELLIHIHGMKGSLASVGAMRLSEEFLAWERLFAAGQGDVCREKLPELLRSLESFRETLGVPAPGEVSGAFREKSLGMRKGLEALRASLAAYDYGAVVAGAESLRRLAESSGQAADFMELFSLVERFDYDAAIDWLNEKGFAA